MAKASDRFALWLTIGRIFSMLAAFVMPMVMTRLLSQADYGVFSQFFTLYLTWNVIFALGFHANLFYFYPTADETGQDEYVSNTLLLLLLMSLASVLILGCPPVGHVFFGDGQLKEYAPWVILIIALAVPMNVISPLVTVREDKWGAIFIPGVFATLRVGVMAIVAAVSHSMHDVLIALVLFQAITLIGILLYAFRHHKIRFNTEKAKRQIAYSVPFGLIVAIQMVVHYFDKLVGIRLMDEVQYAVYSVAFLSIPGINQIYDSLCQVNIVNMTKSYQDGRIDEVRDLYKGFVTKTLSFSTPVILAAALFAEEVFGLLFPPEYIGAARFFRIYSLTFLTAMLGAGTILRAIAKTQYSLTAYLISAAVGLPLTYFLIKSHGASGAIIGSAVNIMLPRLIQLLIEARCLDQPLGEFLRWGDLLRIFAEALLLLIPLWLIKHFLHPGILWCIVLSIVYTLALYQSYLRRGLFIVDRQTLSAALQKLMGQTFLKKDP